MRKFFYILTMMTFSTWAEAKLNPSTESASVFVWGRSHPDWDRVVTETVREEFSRLNQANDVQEFCPGYALASQGQKESCWHRLISALVYKENDEFNPREVFIEPKGLPSVGLMMLSRGECKNAPTDEALKNPVENLRCGIKRMALLIARGDCISCARGAAAYWSTLRTPYRAYGYNLGKKAEIVAMTTNYRVFSSSSPQLPVQRTVPLPTPRPSVTVAQASSIDVIEPVAATYNGEAHGEQSAPVIYEDNVMMQSGFFAF